MISWHKEDISDRKKRVVYFCYDHDSKIFVLEKYTKSKMNSARQALHTLAQDALLSGALWAFRHLIHLRSRYNFAAFAWFAWWHGPLTRYAKPCVAHAPRMPGTFSRHRLQRKPLVSDPSMHHGTCVTHVPWCMSGSINRGGGENVPGIPGASATRNFSYLVRGPMNVWKSCWWRLRVNSVIVFITILSYFPRLLQLQKSGLCFWFQTNYQLGVLW